jgi:hypothetical protein
VTTTINRRNVGPIEVGIGLLIAGIIVLAVLVVVSGGGGGKTADPGELRACLDGEVGTQSDLYGIPGGPSDAQTSFAVTGFKTPNPAQALGTAVDVFVMQDSGAAEDAASHASTAGTTGRTSTFENVMWLTVGSKNYDSRIRNCIGEAS